MKCFLFHIFLIIVITSSSCYNFNDIECSDRDLTIQLDFNNAHYPNRRTSNHCLNIPVNNANPCTSSSVNGNAGENPLSIAMLPPSSSEYYCTIKVDSDCANYPKYYGWLISDVNVSCQKVIQIPDNEYSWIEVTFTETCESCNDDAINCPFSREIFDFYQDLWGSETFLNVSFNYKMSDCSTNSSCN